MKKDNFQVYLNKKTKTSPFFGSNFKKQQQFLSYMFRAEARGNYLTVLQDAASVQCAKTQ